MPSITGTARWPSTRDSRRCLRRNISAAVAVTRLVMGSRMYDRGIKRARFVVIRDIAIPGVLIEGGFLSNSYDAKLIATPAYRQQMASCILQAVQNYRRAVGAQSLDKRCRQRDGRDRGRHDRAARPDERFR